MSVPREGDQDPTLHLATRSCPEGTARAQGAVRAGAPPGALRTFTCPRVPSPHVVLPRQAPSSECPVRVKGPYFRDPRGAEPHFNPPRCSRGPHSMRRRTMQASALIRG